MKKNRWKAMAALAAAAVLALSACGNSGEDGSTQAAASADAGDAAAAAPTGTGEGSGEVGKSDIVIAGKSDIKTLDPMVPTTPHPPLPTATFTAVSLRSTKILRS